MILERTSKYSMRKAYGETLVELGKENKDIVVMDADVASSTQTAMFNKVFPERFFDMGIAEQDMIATATGLASQGKIPFVSAFAIFATGRAYDQVRNSVCYPKFNVKIVATHGGITVGEDGASHQALEDVSLMRGIPNMLVIVPADSKECREAVKYAAKYDGPVYIRIARTNVPDIFDENYEFNPNKALVLKTGKDVTIVTNGETLTEVLDAAEILEEKGIEASIVHTPVVKPFDNGTIIEEAKKTGLVFTVENHSVIGGIGSAVCEALSENCPTKVHRIGINDEFGQSGEQRVLMDYYGLTSEKIAQKIISEMREIK
jgi:transketolase